MPLPILPALIAGAAYLIYSGFREEGPVATPKKGPGRPKGAKAKPKVNVPRETSPKTGTTPKSEAAPKPKPQAAGTKPKPTPKSKPEPKPAPKPEPESPEAGTMPKPKPEPENEKEDDVPRETSPETGTMSDSET